MSLITKSAKGEECQIRIPFVCNYNPKTTVLAHLNGGGWGAKVKDIHGAYACFNCHDVVDGRVPSKYTQDQLKLYHLEGVIRTQNILFDKKIDIIKKYVYNTLNR